MRCPSTSRLARALRCSPPPSPSAWHGSSSSVCYPDWSRMPARPWIFCAAPNASRRTPNATRSTGLANRRVLDRVLPRAEDAAVIMVDLDHFKRLNDTYGHAAGDAVLVAFGRLLVREVRAGDISCRIGGEEFVIVAARTTVPDALALIGRLRAAWSAAAPQPVTFSAGVAAAGTLGGARALLAADAALYRAKALGRDRTEVAPDLTDPAYVAAPIDARDSEETP